MQKPPTPLDETTRLRSLQALRILDTQAEERFDRITRLVRKVFDVPIALVSLVDQERQWFKSRQGLDACETSRDVSFCGHAILAETTFIVPDALQDHRFANNPLVVGEPQVRFYAGHPVHGADGARIGTLCIIDHKPRALQPAEIATLADFASMVDRELFLLSQNTTDELTRISNRRGFTQIAEYVLALCKRNKHTAALIAIDLDGFKQINDTLGHEAGDKVLCGFAYLLMKQFRNSDVVARLGGDEFCVLSSAATAAEMTGTLARLRQTFADSPLAAAYPGIGWSYGVAEFDPAATVAVDQLLVEADSKMYAAKLQAKAHRRASSTRSG